MLVRFGRRKLGKVEHLAGVKHGFSQRGEFSARHAAQQHGHQPCGHLVIGNLVTGVAVDEKLDFIALELSAIALTADQVCD